jgi:beta-N-acetylhexosaminidase
MDGRKFLSIAGVVVGAATLGGACGTTTAKIISQQQDDRASEVTVVIPNTSQPLSATSISGAPDGETTTSVPATSVPASSVPATSVAATSTSLAPTSSTAPPAAVVQTNCVALDGRQLVAQLVMPGLKGSQINTAVSKKLVSLGVGGVIVMSAPASGKPVVTMKTSGEIPLLIAVDEEGGTVQRLKNFGPLPSARKQASKTPGAVQKLITDHATAMRSWGFDVAFSPVIDVAPTKGKGPFDDRTFSSDPDVVTTYGMATVAGWQQAAVLPVLKHFPGHGAASGDTHKVAATTASISQLEARDLLPFNALGNKGAGVMMSHLNVPGLSTGDLPATLDPAVYAYLRSHGHAGALVFTDALEMAAVAKVADVPKAAEMAIVAGADIALTSQTNSAEAIIDRLEAALTAGRLPEARARDAAGRVLAVKGLALCTKPTP